GAKPLDPAFEDMRNAAERLHVIHDGRPAKGAFDRGEWGLDPRPTALAFEAFDQAGLLATDIGAGSAVDVTVDGIRAAEDVFAEIARGVCLVKRPLQDVKLLVELHAHINKGRRRLRCEAGDQNALQQLMRVLL